MRTMFQWTHEMLTHVPCGLKMDDKTCIDKTNDQLSCFSPVPNCLAVPAVCSVSVCTSASKSSIQRFVITTRAFSWLKAATTAFKFKTLLRHYAKRALTPQEKALEGAFSVITNLRMDLFEALVWSLGIWFHCSGCSGCSLDAKYIK